MRTAMHSLALLALLGVGAFAGQSHRRPLLEPQDGGQIESTNGTPGSTGRAYNAAWLHDPDGTGPLEPITIEVSYEPKAGETATVAVQKFANDLQAMKDLFPPNVRSST